MKRYGMRILSVLLSVLLLASVGVTAFAKPAAGIPKKVTSTEGYAWNYTLKDGELRIEAEHMKTWADYGAPFNDYYGGGYSLPFVTSADVDTQNLILSGNGTFRDDVVFGLSPMVKSGEVNRIVYNNTNGYNYVIRFTVSNGYTTKAVFVYRDHKEYAYYHYNNGRLTSVDYVFPEDTSKNRTDTYDRTVLGVPHNFDINGVTATSSNDLRRITSVENGERSTKYTYSWGRLSAMTTTHDKVTESRTFSYKGTALDSATYQVQLDGKTYNETYTVQY